MKLTNSTKYFLTGFIVVFLTAVLLVIAEGAVRARQWLNYGTFGHLGAIYTEDQKHGGLRVPAAGTKTRRIEINSLGFRGPEIPAERPADRIRIAFLGASTTFCAEVSSNEITWPHLVIELLRQAFPNNQIDYVNAAVPGYAVRSSLANLRLRVKSLDPQVIVIYHATNDLSAETRGLAAGHGLYEAASETKSHWLAEHSLLWYLVQKNWEVMEAKVGAATGVARLNLRPDALGERFRTDLTELVGEAKRVAAVVVLPTFSYKIRREQPPEVQLEAAASALYYQPYMTPKGLLAGFERYNQVIREVAREQDVVLVGGEMQIPGDDEHFNDTVHFNDLGSRVMARRVSEALLKNGAFLSVARSLAETVSVTAGSAVASKTNSRRISIRP